jgi:hypothetical protein
MIYNSKVVTSGGFSGSPSPWVEPRQTIFWTIRSRFKRIKLEKVCCPTESSTRNNKKKEI